MSGARPHIIPDETEADREKENRDRLLGCRRHLFDIPSDEQEAACTRCGGTMSKAETEAYASGFKAAGGDPADILRLWYEAKAAA